MKRDDMNLDLLKTAWNGWFFENGLLWDENGNFYTQDDIKYSWKSQMLLEGHFGKKSNILTLKEKLEHRTALLSPPKITLSWKSPKGEIIREYQIK